MTDRDKIIETMARGMYGGFRVERDEAPVTSWEDHANFGEDHAAYIDAATDILTALQASGMAVVPVEPTPEMIRAAEDADPSIGFDGCPFDVSWRAMLSAFNPVVQEDPDHG